MGIKGKKNFFDASDFDEIGDALDLFINTINNSFEFDALGDKETFNAIVLTPPVPIGASGKEMDTFLAGVEGKFVDTLPKFIFRARMVEADSAHVFWPDPCDPRFIESAETQEEVIDWISKYLKVIAIGATQVPRVGDTVRVKLSRQGIFTASPEYAIMEGVITSLDSISEEARVLLNSQECQTKLETLFQNYDGTTNGSPESLPSTAFYPAGNVEVENGKLEDAGIELFSPPSELFDNGETFGKYATVPFFIPQALGSFMQLATDFKKEFGYAISISDSYRSFDRQVEMRNRKGSGAAIAGYSNHGWGVAFDVNGTNEDANGDGTTSIEERFNSKVYKWLDNEGKGRYGWVNPVGLRKEAGPKAEAWHWENTSIRDVTFTGLPPVPDYAEPDAAEEAPEK